MLRWAPPTWVLKTRIKTDIKWENWQEAFYYRPEIKSSKGSEASLKLAAKPAWAINLKGTRAAVHIFNRKETQGKRSCDDPVKVVNYKFCKLQQAEAHKFVILVVTWAEMGSLVLLED